MSKMNKGGETVPSNKKGVFYRSPQKYGFPLPHPSVHFSVLRDFHYYPTPLVISRIRPTPSSPLPPPLPFPFFFFFPLLLLLYLFPLPSSNFIFGKNMVRLARVTEHFLFSVSSHFSSSWALLKGEFTKNLNYHC